MAQCLRWICPPIPLEPFETTTSLEPFESTTLEPVDPLQPETSDGLAIGLGVAGVVVTVAVVGFVVSTR